MNQRRVQGAAPRGPAVDERWGSLARPLAGLAVLTVIALVGVSVLPIPLPHPASHHKVLPWTLHEQPSALKGPYKPNTALQSSKKLLTGRIQGSESVAVTPSGGHLFLADKFGAVFKGRIIREGGNVDVELEPEKPVANVTGRPLGIHAISEDVLLVCDSVAGLVRVDVNSHSATTLASHAETTDKDRLTSNVTLANDLEVAADGVVYFTDCADIPTVRCPEGYHSTFRSYLLNMLQGGATGRLLSYNPETLAVVELKGKLWYANGVAVAKDGSFVAVVETNGLRVHRYWLKGPNAGRSDLLISNLPGYPDGISTAPDGNFWIALLAPVSPLWRILPFSKFRLFVAWLTEYVKMPYKSWGYVIKVSPEGEVLTVLSDVDGAVIRATSSAIEHDGMLFLGNLNEDYISVFDLSLLTEPAHEDSDRDKEEL